MQEFQKSQCLYHPAEYITNFCKEKTCLMPLCPTCICSHLDLHLKGGKSNPQFDNINDSFIACSKEIRAFSEKFEEGRSQLNSIQRTIVEQKKQLSELVYTTKLQVREIVQATFDILEKDLEAAIDRQNQALGLHLPDSLDTLQKGLIQIGSKLREMNSDLRSDRSLSTLITFNHQTRASLEKYQSDISKEIKNNEEYAPIVSVNQEAINRLKQMVSQVITLKFNFPQAMKQQQAVQAQQTVKVSQNIQPMAVSQSGSANPSLIRTQPISDRAPLRPTALTSPTKALSPSFISGGTTKVGEIGSTSASQAAGKVTQGFTSGQIGGQVGTPVGGPSVVGSSLDGKYKRSEVLGGGQGQNI